MRLTNPQAWLNTTPRRLVVTFLGLLLVGTIAEGTVSTAYGKLGATATNANNTYAASTCFQPVGITGSGSGSTQFSPNNVTIKAGCSIKWTITSSTSHTSTSSTGLWNSGSLSSGGTYTRQFTSTGSFGYKCNFHPGVMFGTITVN
jgi:plastocyanin